MEQENISSSKPKLIISIISIVLAIINAVFVVIIVLYDFGVIPYRDKLPTICFVGALITLSGSVILRFKSSKTARICVTCLSVVCFISGAIAFPNSLFKSFGDINELESHRQGQELATIENAISYMKTTNFSIVAKASSYAGNYVEDEDKAITNKFASYNFTYVSEDFFFEKGSNYFQLRDMTIYFSDDYTGIVVYVPSERTMWSGGHDEGINSYSISKENADELKGMIDKKYDELIEEGLKQYEEGKDKLSISDAINYLDTVEYAHNIDFRTTTSGDIKKVADKNHAINKKLKTIDFSQVWKIETDYPDYNLSWNISFSDTGDSKFKWEYSNSSRHFHLKITFYIPYEGFKTFSADYILDDTTGDNLMKIVQEGVKNIQA